MLLVKTKLDKSPIHGVGVFACQDIRRGTRIWEFNPVVDVAIAPAELAGLPEPARSVVETLSYYDEERDAYILSADGAQYMNHSDDPNIGDDVALRNITAGEELTEDYYDEYEEGPDD